MLFGNKSNSSYDTSSDLEEKERQEKLKHTEEVKEEYKKFYDQYSAIVGTVVSVDGKPFDTKEKYKFYLNDDNFVFVKIPPYFSYANDISVYETALNEKPIVLPQDKFECTLVQQHGEIVRSDKYIGVENYTIQPIVVCFQNKEDSNHKIVVTTANDIKNLAPTISFYVQTGLRNYYNILQIPYTEVFTISVQHGNGYIRDGEHQMWRDNNCLVLVNRYQGHIETARIPISDILYYKLEGELRYEQQISGGGGMGINYGGALIGGLLFGGAGATIGSRKNEEIKSIQSSTVSHDSRIIILAVTYESAVYQVGFSINNELAFDWLIPEKQYDFVINQRREMYLRQQ